MTTHHHHAAKYHQPHHQNLAVASTAQMPQDPGRLVHTMDAGHGWLHLESNVPSSDCGLSSDGMWLAAVIFALLIGKRLSRRRDTKR